MKFLFIAVFLLMFQGAFSKEKHPFYVSIVEINVNTEEQLLECAVKIFTDDLEKALRAQFQQPVLNIGAPKELDTAEVLIKRYLKQTMIFTINNAPAEFRWLGKEGNLEHQWMYFELPFTSFDSFTLKSAQLMEIFSDQTNLVHFRFNGEENAFIFKTNQPQKIYL